MTFAPRTWVVGEVVTAALLNQEVRDQFSSIFDAWTTYTPTWTAATTNPVVGNATIAGRYLKIGRKCIVDIRIQMGSTTTYGSGVYSFSVPFTSASSVDYLGNARLASTDTWIGQTVLSGGNAAFQCVFSTSSGDSRAATMSPTVPNTLANTHILRAQLEYQTST
ncbi:MULTISPECIES: hypothetical protein [unclassified Streptomyces]|uniref:hypothetical protein n=1 Tax=unclassified Streptomyces TaxID=2593676 RepID=UPI00380A4AF0